MATALIAGTDNEEIWPLLFTVTVGHDAVSSLIITLQYVPVGKPVVSVPLLHTELPRLKAMKAALPRAKAIWL